MSFLVRYVLIALVGLRGVLHAQPAADEVPAQVPAPKEEAIQNENVDAAPGEPEEVRRVGVMQTALSFTELGRTTATQFSGKMLRSRLVTRSTNLS
jgi:hypothetical protein